MSDPASKHYELQPPTREELRQEKAAWDELRQRAENAEAALLDRDILLSEEVKGVTCSDDPDSPVTRGHPKLCDAFTGLLLKIEDIEAECEALRKECDVLKQLRPQWAMGFTSDSVAAQVKASALSEIWKALGVQDQTSAMQKIAAMSKEVK